MYVLRWWRVIGGFESDTNIPIPRWLTTEFPAPVVASGFEHDHSQDLLNVSLNRVGWEYSFMPLTTDLGEYPLYTVRVTVGYMPTARVLANSRQLTTNCC